MYRTLCRVGARSGFFPLLAHQNRTGVAILMYHGLRDTDSLSDLTEYRRMHVLAPEFRRQMMVLRRERYAIASLSEAVQGLAGGRTLPPRTVVVTFDDGYRSTYTHAWPICRELGIPLTVYVVTDFIEHGTMLWTSRLEMALRTARRRDLQIEIEGRPLHFSLAAPPDRDGALLALLARLKAAPAARLAGYLAEIEGQLGVPDAQGPDPVHQPCTWAMRREMAATGGAEIGAHTMTQSILSRLDPADAVREVGEAERVVTQRVGVPCRHFAYPNGKAGDFNEDSVRIVREAGFASATTTVEGTNRIGDSPFTLRRFGIYGHYRTPEFLGMITGFHASLSRLLGRPA